MKKSIFFLIFLIFLMGYVLAEELECTDDGYVLCKGTDICGPSEEWCKNYLNSQISCIPGENWCCYNVGYVADYTEHWCCHPDYPFLTNKDGIKNCWSNPSYVYDFTNYIFLSDNYWTSLSNDCLPPLPPEYPMNPTREKASLRCSENKLQTCEEVSKWIYLWNSGDYIVGKCGVECLQNLDCGAGSYEKFCKEKELKQHVVKKLCSYIQCESNEYDEVLEICEFGCGQLPCPEGLMCTEETRLGCLDYSCTEGTKECSGQDLLICEDNQIKFLETCEFGCENNKCNEPPPICNNNGVCDSGENKDNCPNDCEENPFKKYILVISGIILIIIVVSLAIYLTSKQAKIKW